MQHNALDPFTHPETISEHLCLGHEISGIWMENAILVQLHSKLPSPAELFQCWLSILVHKLHCRRLEAAEGLDCFKELYIYNLCTSIPIARNSPHSKN